MNQPHRVCPSCAAPLAADVPQGLCPRCLLLAGLAGRDATVLHVRCPHCQNPIEIVDAEPVLEVVCPSCDTHFSLVGDATLSYDQPAKPKVGRFELLRQLGMGAFGSVWQARDPLLDRVVAVKIPRKGQLNSDETQKFVREAQSAAGLKHPGIVSVHEIVVDDDRLYIVSDFIDGVTLADKLLVQPLHVDQAAQLCESIAAALDHAHQAGVVHRDLKPSNILLDGVGQPHLTDFGLAKRAATEVTMTVDGQILGTPAYMSPEQARGEANQADGRSDIYSLGVILFETLTGERPFRGNSRMLLHQVLHEDPPSPRRMNSRIPRDLETICLKCLQKDPRRRYATARDLEADLRRFRLREPIQARPVSAWEHAWRWSLRNPLPAALTGLLVVAILVGFAGVSWQWRRALWQQRIAEQRADERRQQLVRNYVSNGARALDLGDPLEGLVWFAVALLNDDGSAAREESHRRRLGTIGRQLPRLVHLLPHPRPAQATFSRDGRRILAIAGGEAHLWDAQTGRQVFAPLRAPLPIRHALFSPDQSRVAVIAASEQASPPTGRIAMHDAESGARLFLTDEFVGFNWWLATFTPDGTTLLVGAGRHVHFLDARTGQTLRPPLEQPYHVRWLAVSSRGRRLLVNSGALENSNEVRLMNWQTGEQIGSAIEGEEFGADDPWASDGQSFVTTPTDFTGGRGSAPSEVHVWDADTGQRTQTLATPEKVARLMLSRAGRSVVVAHCNDGRIVTWDASTGKAITSGIARRSLTEFALDATGTRLVAAERGQSRIVLANLDESNAIVAEYDVDGIVDRVAFSPDGQRILICVRHGGQRLGELQLIDVNAQERTLLSVPHQYGGLNAEFSPDGQRLLCSDNLGFVRVWDLTTLGSSLRDIADFRDEGVRLLALSPSEKWLAIGQGHHDLAVDRSGAQPFGALGVWDLKSGRRVGPDLRFEARVETVDFGSNERQVAVTLSDGSAHVVDVEAGTVLRTIPGGPDFFAAAAVLNDQRQLVIYASTHDGSYWTLQRDQARIEVRSLESPGAVISQTSLPPHDLVALAPGGELYFIADHDRKGQIVNRSGPRVALGKLHAAVKRAEFSRSGERILLVYEDGIVQMLDVASGMLAAPLIRGADDARFSSDARCVLAKHGAACQVWDAHTAEPLSLPISIERIIGAPRLEAFPTFGPGGLELISTARDRLRVWNLSPDSRPPDDLSRWSQLLGGHRVDGVGGYSLHSNLAATWASYVARYPLDLRNPSRQEVLQWRRREAWQSEVAANNAYPPAAAQLDWSAARFHLNALVAAENRNADLRKRRGTAHLALNEAATAVDDFSQALALGLASDPTVWLRRGRALALQGQLERAASDVARAFELGEPETKEELAPWEQQAAIVGWSRRIEQHPRDDDLRFRRANLLWEVNSYARGLADYDELLARGDTRFFTRFRRGDCLAGLERWPEAIEAYTLAMGDQDDDPDVLESRAAAAAMAGDFAAALRDLKKVPKLVSYVHPALHSQAIVHLLAGDEASYQAVCRESLEVCRQHFGETLEQVPGEVATDVARLCCLGADAGVDMPRVVALARRGRTGYRASEPRTPRTLGAALYRAGEWAEALEVLAATERQFPDHIGTRAWLAMTCQRLGRADEAKSWLEQAEARLAREPRWLPLLDWAESKLLVDEARRHVPR